MTHYKESATSGSTTNGVHNGSSNGVPKQCNKPIGKPATPVLKYSQLFSGRFNALYVFALAGVLWAAISISPRAPDTYAVCSRDGERVYTVDANNTKVQCIVVSQAHIADTGSLLDIKRRWGDSTFLEAVGVVLFRPSFEIRYIPPGSILIPGISDSHTHILEYGASQELPLEGTPTVPDTVTRVREFILNNPDVLKDKTRWIRGGGWDHTIWPTASWPSAAELEADPVIRGRPVVLQSKDCHALWVSEEAMRFSAPFPGSVEGGVIVRNGSGRPTGVFLDNAQVLIKQPELTEDDLLRRFNLAIKHALAKGLTSVHDAGLDPISLAFFKKQATSGVLPIRIYGMRYFNENQPYWGNTTQIILGEGEDRLTARSVKIFADGALRTGGAALYEPYHDNPSTPGFMRLDPEVLFDVIPKFLRDGWQVNVHAIGDRANGLVLDAFEASLKGTNVTALRPRLEHAQIMTEADMRRLGELGVIASVQPTHAISDMWFAEDRLGPERVKLLYAFRSMKNSGARITLGSDSPVESMNPISTFYAAVTRVSPDGKSPHGPEGWFPEQRLSRVEALRGMTIDPAYASFTEDTLGSLEPGKRADFTVLSQDIMTVLADAILDTGVIATVIDGKALFGHL